MTDLTEQARANLESGATDGPGTDVCRGCGGPKEPTRLNSSRCRTCGGKKGSPPPRATLGETRSLRTELPVAVWDRLSQLAAEAGVPLGTYTRRVLTEHVEQEVSGPSDTPVTPAMWQEVVAFVRSHPAEWSRYTGPSDTKREADRAAVYRWFLETRDKT
jgi:hypothetical protein